MSRHLGLHLRAFDPGVDEQQVEGFALELLAQGDHGLLIIHVELFDLHVAQCFQRLGVRRIANRGGDLPTVGQQGFHQAQAEAAEAPMISACLAGLSADMMGVP